VKARPNLYHLSDPEALFASLDAVYVRASHEEVSDRLSTLAVDVQRIEDALVSTAVRFAHLPAEVVREATRELEAQLILAKVRRAMAERLARDEEARTRQRREIEDL
jgi:hypothetical protein